MHMNNTNTYFCSTGGDFWFDENQPRFSQLLQHSYSQNATPWRYYCSCKNKCFRCSSFWWPTCPRLSASQSTNNCYLISNFYKQQHQSLAQENISRMSNGNLSSPARSASPLPAPPPPQARVCSLSCRLITPDTNHSQQQQTPIFENACNPYTGKSQVFFCRAKHVHKSVM